MSSVLRADQVVPGVAVDLGGRCGRRRGGHHAHHAISIKVDLPFAVGAEQAPRFSPEADLERHVSRATRHGPHRRRSERSRW